MGVDDMINKAKEALGGEAAVDEKIDQAADAVKEVTPDAADATVDQVANVVKDQI